MVSCKYYKRGTCTNRRIIEFMCNEEEMKRCVYRRKPERALRFRNARYAARSIIDAIDDIMVFDTAKSIVIDVQNDMNDYIMCRLTYEDGVWKMHDIHTEVQGEHVSSIFKKCVRNNAK